MVKKKKKEEFFDFSNPNNFNSISKPKQENVFDFSDPSNFKKPNNLINTFKLSGEKTADIKTTSPLLRKQDIESSIKNIVSLEPDTRKQRTLIEDELTRKGYDSNEINKTLKEMAKRDNTVATAFAPSLQSLGETGTSISSGSFITGPLSKGQEMVLKEGSKTIRNIQSLFLGKEEAQKRYAERDPIIQEQLDKSFYQHLANKSEEQKAIDNRLLGVDYVKAKEERIEKRENTRKYLSWSMDREYTPPEERSEISRVLESAIDTVVDQAPSIVVALATHNPTLATAVMGAGAYGSTESEMLAEGKPLSEATTTAYLKAATAVIVEKLVGGNKMFGKGTLDSNMDKLIGKIGTQTANQKFWNFLATKGYQIGGEVLEENLEDITGYFIDNLISGDELPNLKEVLNNASETSKVTALSTILLNVMGLGGDNLSVNENIELTKKITGVDLTENETNQLKQVGENTKNIITEIENDFAKQDQKQPTTIDVDKSLDTIQGKELSVEEKPVKMEPGAKEGQVSDIDTKPEQKQEVKSKYKDKTVAFLKKEIKNDSKKTIDIFKDLVSSEKIEKATTLFQDKKMEKTFYNEFVNNLDKNIKDFKLDPYKNRNIENVSKDILLEIDKINAEKNIDLKNFMDKTFTELKNRLFNGKITYEQFTKTFESKVDAFKKRNIYTQRELDTLVKTFEGREITLKDTPDRIINDLADNYAKELNGVARKENKARFIKDKTFANEMLRNILPFNELTKNAVTYENSVYNESKKIVDLYKDHNIKTNDKLINSLLERYGENSISIDKIKESLLKRSKGDIDVAEQQTQAVVEMSKEFRALYDEYLKRLNESLQKNYPNDKNMVVNKRENYMRHMVEFTESVSVQDLIKKEFDTRVLFGDSKTGILKRRTGEKSSRNAYKSMLNYIETAEFLINMEGSKLALKNSANAIQFMKGIENSPNKKKLINLLEMNNALLEGKRITPKLFTGTYTAMDIVPGGLNAVITLNNIAKQNLLRFNFSTALKQISNIPTFNSMVKNPQSVFLGLYNMFTDSDVSKQNEYYQSRATKSVKGSVLDKANSYMLDSLELFSQRFMLNVGAVDAEIELKKGNKLQTIEGDRLYLNPMEYAEALTKKASASRVTGEVSLKQKATTTKLFMPFTTELENSARFWVDKMKHGGSKNLVESFIKYQISAAALNTVLKAVTGYDDIPFDFINAILGYVKEEKKREEKEGEDFKRRSALEHAGRVLLRGGGTILKGLPESKIFSTVTKDIDSSKKLNKALYGDSDPSYFGLEPPGISLLTKVASQAIGGKNIDYIDVISTLGYSKQIGKTIKGLQSIGVLPVGDIRIEEDKEIGEKRFVYDYQKPSKVVKASKGQVSFIQGTDPISSLKSVLFGQYATIAGQEYLENAQPYGEKQSALIYTFDEKGLEPEKATETIQKLKDIEKKIKMSGDEYEKLSAEEKKKKQKEKAILVEDIVKEFKDKDIKNSVYDYLFTKKEDEKVEKLEKSGINSNIARQYMLDKKTIIPDYENGKAVNASELGGLVYMVNKYDITDKEKETLFKDLSTRKNEIKIKDLKRLKTEDDYKNYFRLVNSKDQVKDFNAYTDLGITPKDYFALRDKMLEVKDMQTSTTARKQEIEKFLNTLNISALKKAILYNKAGYSAKKIISQRQLETELNNSDLTKQQKEYIYYKIYPKKKSYL